MVFMLAGGGTDFPTNLGPAAVSYSDAAGLDWVANRRVIVPTHHDFVRRLLAEPTDDLTRLVYADWLDEQGDADSRLRAEFLRADCAWAGVSPADPARDRFQRQLRSLSLTLPTRWKAAVSKVEVWVTAVEGRDCCPRSWDRLRLTDDRKVRECPACGEPVAYCTTIGQGVRQSHLGAIAFDHYVLLSPADPEFGRYIGMIQAHKAARDRIAALTVDPVNPTEYTRRVSAE